MNNIIFSNNRAALPSPSNSPDTPPKKNKMDFKKMKNNTINSLNEVEAFLGDFNRFKHYIKLYKILK